MEEKDARNGGVKALPDQQGGLVVFFYVSLSEV